jgi:HSP20 family protein
MTTLKTLLPRRWRADEENGFTTLQRAMNELFEDYAPVLEAPDFSGLSTGRPAWIPRLDVVEGDKEITVTADLPGLDEKQVEVRMVGGTLTIQGEKRTQHEAKDKTFHRCERSWGAFARQVQLPCEIDPRNTKAIFDKGVLTVTLPKAQPAERSACRIEVKRPG